MARLTSMRTWSVVAKARHASEFTQRNSMTPSR
jgi:hypothetical protein